MVYDGPIREARPLKRPSLMPIGNVWAYDTTTAYILGDIDQNVINHNPSASYIIHRDKCDEIRDVFNNTIACDTVNPVYYGAGRDSQWVLQYFRNEISQRGENDVMIVYVHGLARGNGLEYVWQIDGNPRFIGAHAFLNLWKETDVDLKIIFDGPTPSRYDALPDIKREQGNTEYISSGLEIPNPNGSRHRHGLTESIADMLGAFIARAATEPWKLRRLKRKTIPELMRRDRNLTFNVPRFWFMKTEKDSDDLVHRFVVEPGDVAWRGKILLHKCRIQGPLLPGPQGVPGDLPPDHGDDDRPANDDDNGSDGDETDVAGGCGGDNGDGGGLSADKRNGRMTRSNDNEDHLSETTRQAPSLEKKVWNPPIEPKAVRDAKRRQRIAREAATGERSGYSLKRAYSPGASASGRQEERRPRFWGPESAASLDFTSEDRGAKRIKVEPQDDFGYPREERRAYEARDDYRDYRHDYPRDERRLRGSRDDAWDDRNLTPRDSWWRFDSRSERREIRYEYARDGYTRYDPRDDYYDNGHSYSSQSRRDDEPRRYLNDDRHGDSRDRRESFRPRRNDRDNRYQIARGTASLSSYRTPDRTDFKEREAKERREMIAKARNMSRLGHSGPTQAGPRRRDSGYYQSRREKPALRSRSPRADSPLFVEA